MPIGFACQLIELSHERNERASFDSCGCRMLICASAVNRLAINEGVAAKTQEQWPPITRINYESKLVHFSSARMAARIKSTARIKSRNLVCLSCIGAQSLHTMSQQREQPHIQSLFSKLSCRKLRQAGIRGEGCFNMGACPHAARAGCCAQDRRK